MSTRFEPLHRDHLEPVLCEEPDAPEAELVLLPYIPPRPAEAPRRRTRAAIRMIVLLFALLLLGLGALLVAIPMGGLVLYLDYSVDEARADWTALTRERQQIEEENLALVEDVAELGEAMSASIGRERYLHEELGTLKQRVTKKAITVAEVEAKLTSVEQELAATQQSLVTIQEQLSVAQKKLKTSARLLAGHAAFDRLLPEASRAACGDRPGLRCEEEVEELLFLHKSAFLECASMGDLPKVQTLSSRIPDHYVVLGRGSLSSVALALCDPTLPEAEDAPETR